MSPRNGYSSRVTDRKPTLVFTPSPLLTVTVEDRGGEPDLHVHAGGQGVWQTRMLTSLGVRVVLCVALGGETGHVLRGLLPHDGVELVAEHVDARNGGYVHDRRSGDRDPLVEIPGEALTRHDLDDLYESTLLAGLRSDPAVLSGPAHDRIIPVEVYRRLAADLGAVGCRVVADLAGERLDAALAGGIHFLKVSDEELVDDERASGTDPVELVKAMHRLRDNGARAVLVSRADEPALALLDEKSDDVLEVHMPPLHAQDSSGAGDSMTAAVAAALNLGAELTDAVRLGAAAGALNVTRAGLGTGDGGAARELAGLVELRPHD